MRSVLSLALAVMAVGVGSTASAETATIGRVDQVAGMSAWGGHLVFSALDPATYRWHLLEATTKGIRALPVPAQQDAINADVGPDGHGLPAVVYSLCAARLAVRGARCHLHELSLARAEARPRLVRSLLRKRYSDVAPSIWRGRIAFGRTLTGVPTTHIAAMFVQRRPGSHALIRLDRGTVPGCSRPPCGYREAHPVQSDLGEHSLALTWTWTEGQSDLHDDREVWRMPLNGRAGTLLEVGRRVDCGMGPPISFVSFDAPSVDGRRVDYLRLAGDCWPTHSAFVRTGPSPMQQRRHVVDGDHLAYGMARDGDRFWWVRGGRITPETPHENPCAASPCTLMLSSHVRFHAVRVRRRPVPPIDPTLLG